MSTVPLRVDTDLMSMARSQGKVMERTPTAQIEYWAKLGRVVESVLSHESLIKVKQAAQVVDLDRLLLEANSPEGKARALAEIQKHRGPVYGSDPDDDGVLIETLPDGTTRRGKFVNREFMPFA